MITPAFARFAGVVYRATTYDTPLWVSPNRRDGRWSRAAEGDTVQYCCLDPAAPFAEVIRHENLTESEAGEARFGLWELRVNEGSIINLATPEMARRNKVEWDDLTADKWGSCQELGEWARRAGARGVVAPSAALPGSVNLMLFGPRTELDWGRESVLSVQIPARAVVRGAPQPGLVRATRMHGQSYPDQVVPRPIDHLLRS